MATSTAVVCRNLGVSFVSFTSSRRLDRRVEVHALRDIDLELCDGDALGMVGHNGSGKSTLMQVVAGLLMPTEGEVLVRAAPRLLGINTALNRRLTGNQNIEIGCYALGVSRADIGDITREVADFTELGDFLELPVLSYSAGMRQRLAFSISAIVRPEILLIDEALAVGDRGFKAKCLDKIIEIKNAAGVVMLASHSMTEILQSCNRAIWLHGGEIVFAGKPSEVVEAYEESKREVNRSLQ